MARPTYGQWRNPADPLQASAPAMTIRMRILAALASYALQTAPDGTPF